MLSMTVLVRHYRGRQDVEMMEHSGVVLLHLAEIVRLGGNNEQIRTSKRTGTLVWCNSCYSETRACQEQSTDAEGAEMSDFYPGYRSVGKSTMVFAVPNGGTANISVTAEELTIIAASIANMSYDIDGGLRCLESHESKDLKLKAIYACMERADEFNALAVRLGKVALVMDTEEGA
jgi:hypothetical protein